MASPTIESVLQEQRLFYPSTDFSEQATISSMEQYKALYDKAAADPAQFWAELADQELHWFKPWDTN
jgi:acetyl-CoA synthetase